jgi:putative transposase
MGVNIPSRLTPLPPYSPELNPMENVWEYLRANRLCALVWDSYEATIEACRTAGNFLINHPDGDLAKVKSGVAQNDPARYVRL